MIEHTPEEMKNQIQDQLMFWEDCRKQILQDLDDYTDGEIKTTLEELASITTAAENNIKRPELNSLKITYEPGMTGETIMKITVPVGSGISVLNPETKMCILSTSLIGNAVWRALQAGFGVTCWPIRGDTLRDKPPTATLVVIGVRDKGGIKAEVFAKVLADELELMVVDAGKIALPAKTT